MTDHRSLCIHAHFYQPPREDPFTNQIPGEPGADPYKNWNEKILATCYSPNVEMGNFSRISFNIGPTLSKWMGGAAPSVLEKIIEEDRQNLTRYGVGNAIAQPYDHIILPLASRRDKETQIHWGIRAFHNLYGRLPKGMWLPETAVDLETLEIMSENGIQFTILAPWQVEGEHPEYNSPYRVELKDGKSIIVFIYHGGLSSKVSFDIDATTNADFFAERFVLPEFKQEHTNQVMMIATDGELYGHHQPFRDKFLSHLMNGSTSRLGVTTTFPELWLETHTVETSIKIRENTSWSCHHGVERWRGECSCTPGSTWKKPLREALDIVANAIDGEYIRMVTDLGIDPWKLRNDYISVILGEFGFDQLLSAQSNRDFDLKEINKLKILLQAQYERQRMYASCGWFFEDLSRIEPQNNLSYAAHAVSLMEMVSNQDFISRILPILELPVSKKTGLSAKDRFLKSYGRFSNN